jgi:hypothetical protein
MYVHLERRRPFSLLEKVFSSSTFTKVSFSFFNSKTDQTTFSNFSNHAFYLPRAVSKVVLLQRMLVTVVLSFSFLIISVESLKNHSKS